MGFRAWGLGFLGRRFSGFEALELRTSRAWDQVFGLQDYQALEPSGLGLWLLGSWLQSPEESFGGFGAIGSQPKRHISHLRPRNSNVVDTLFRTGTTIAWACGLTQRLRGAGLTLRDAVFGVQGLGLSQISGFWISFEFVDQASEIFRVRGFIVRVWFLQSHRRNFLRKNSLQLQLPCFDLRAKEGRHLPM